MRYLIFTGQTYYPEGSWDYIGKSDDLDEAKRLGKEHKEHWIHILDSQNDIYWEYDRPDNWIKSEPHKLIGKKNET